MDRTHTFARDEVLPSYWANRIQDFISLAALNFRLTRLNATTLRVPANAGNGACIGVQGLWRFVEANVDRAHPGGGAGTYDVYVTAKAQSIASSPAPNTDNTDYSFALAIVASGATPAIVAGVVDVYRKVGSVQWDGAQITQLDTIIQMPSDAMPIDGPAGQATRRTLGSGAQQAMAGNATPTPSNGSITWAKLASGLVATGPNTIAAGSHKAQHEPGGADALTLLDDTSMAAAVKDGLASRASLRTLGYGAQQARPGADAADLFAGSGVVQAGVIGTDLLPTTVGGSTQTQIAAGSIWIPSASGVITKHVLAAAVTVTHAANGPGSDRIDSVVATYAGPGSAPTIQLVQGTPTAGTVVRPTSANYRKGAPGGTGGPALPANSVILRDVVVFAGTSTIADAVDRRPWACGARARAIRTSGDIVSGATAGQSLGSWAVIPLELSGRWDVIAELVGTILSGSTVQTPVFRLMADNPTNQAIAQGDQAIALPIANASHALRTKHVFTPASAGAHSFQPQFDTTQAITVQANATRRLVWSVYEDVRGSAMNTWG